MNKRIHSQSLMKLYIIWKCKREGDQSFLSNDGPALAKHLRVVAEELNRSSDVLNGTVNDAINFYDEVNGRIVNNYVGVNVKQG